MISPLIRGAALALAALAPVLAADSIVTVAVDGLARSYRLHAPERLPVPAPLVLMLHGGGGSARQAQRDYGFDAVADGERFLVAYPEGIDGHWADGRGTPADEQGIDDVAFLAAVIDSVAASRPVAAKRVFATGISNGAFMCHRFANDSTRVAAIASVAASISTDLAERFAPSAPVSVLFINGTDDPFVPYDGGRVRGGAGSSIGVDDAVAAWCDADGIAGLARVTLMPDADPRDGTRVLRHERRHGAGGTDVELYQVVGGGHTWPGASRSALLGLAGRVSYDIDATPLIWSFFAAHPRRVGGNG